MFSLYERFSISSMTWYFLLLRFEFRSHKIFFQNRTRRNYFSSLLRTIYLRKNPLKMEAFIDPVGTAQIQCCSSSRDGYRRYLGEITCQRASKSPTDHESRIKTRHSVAQRVVTVEDKELKQRTWPIRMRNDLRIDSSMNKSSYPLPTEYNKVQNWAPLRLLLNSVQTSVYLRSIPPREKQNSTIKYAPRWTITNNSTKNNTKFRKMDKSLEVKVNVKFRIFKNECFHLFGCRATDNNTINISRGLYIIRHICLNNQERRCEWCLIEDEDPLPMIHWQFRCNHKIKHEYPSAGGSLI